MNTRSLILTAIALTAVACGDADVEVGSGADPGLAAGANALVLSPRVDVIGVDDIYDVLQLAELSFAADLFVLPVAAESSNPGAVVSIRVDVDASGVRTEAVDGDLGLDTVGKYRVLLRVRPSDEGVSVSVDGTVSGPVEARGKATAEPAPTTAEPAPTTAEPGDDGDEEEPAPTTAEPGDDDEDEPAPTPAEPAPTPAEPAPTPAEPAPTPAEPAPTPADDPWGESGDAYEPVPGDDDRQAPRAEPAPIPAEPAPGTDRAKAGLPGIDPGATRTSGAEISMSSRRSFEFYVGVVEIETDDTELVITWDVRHWLRDLLAEPLGIAPTAPEGPAVAGVFLDIADHFQLIAR